MHTQIRHSTKGKLAQPHIKHKPITAVKAVTNTMRRATQSSEERSTQLFFHLYRKWQGERTTTVTTGTPCKEGKTTGPQWNRVGDPPRRHWGNTVSAGRQTRCAHRPALRKYCIGHFHLHGPGREARHSAGGTAWPEPEQVTPLHLLPLYRPLHTVSTASIHTDFQTNC